MSIPASEIVRVTPGVLPAGGRSIDMIGLMLTTSDRVPTKTAKIFETAEDVSDYFGPSSTEAALATIYFAGFTNSSIKPSRVLFAQYPEQDVPAYMRGGSLAGMTLTELKAIPVGTLTLTVNGQSSVAAAVDLSSAVSFSSAATIIGAAFQNTTASATNCTISGTTLTVGGTISGSFGAGMTITGTGVTAGSYITEQLTGTEGGAGTYQLSASSTVGSPITISGGMWPVVTYDSVTQAFVFTTKAVGDDQTISAAAENTFAAALNLTTSTGAVTSDGAAMMAPGPFMDALLSRSRNWATFMTVFDPDAPGSNDNKMAFAKWTNGKVNQYAYVCWDVDKSPAQTSPAVSSMGYLLQTLKSGGTCMIGGDVNHIVSPAQAAFICGAAASIDFNRRNGRITFAFRRQSGLEVTCDNASAAGNLNTNGYNFYGAYATRSDDFNFFYNGQVSGEFLWLDTYINQIWLNNQIQGAVMNLMLAKKSIPYNQAGYNDIRTAVKDPINAAINFGCIRAGVTLSEMQAAAIDDDAGVPVSRIITDTGWYFQVQDASPQVRQERGSPPCTLWYADGGSVHRIDIASIAVL